MIKEHSTIQVSADRHGRSVVFDLKVFERNTRKKTKLFAETQCADNHHFIIQFFVKEADSVDEIIQLFCGQLIHRGFEPSQLRFKNRGWGPWQTFTTAN